MVLCRRKRIHLLSAEPLLALFALCQLFDQVWTCEVSTVESLASRHPRKPKLLCASNLTTVEVGSNVTLRCEFDRAVTCMWKFNNHPKAPDNRKYVLKTTAKSSNCSLLIISASAGDDGIWQCHSPAASSYNATESMEIQLKVKKKSQRTLANVTVGQSITLQCEKRLPGNCKWIRNNSEILIDGTQYQLMSNCTLFIAKLEKDDLTRWECQDEPPQCQEGMKTTSPNGYKIGEWVSLNCKFEVAGDCVWKRRGQRLNVDNRYEYQRAAKKDNSTNCSINIMSFKDLDTGNWECVQLGADMATCRQSARFTLSVATDSNVSFLASGCLAIIVIVILVVLTLMIVLKHRRGIST